MKEMIPLWEQVLALFGVEISDTCQAGCFHVRIPALDLFGEGLIIEGRRIVGKAAIIDVDVNALESTGGELPYGMDLNFEQQTSILEAGKRTALLETEVELDNRSTEYHRGTAFFVSENHLLTAAHNVVPKSGKVTKISVRYEGLKKIEPTGTTYKCRVVSVMPNTSSASEYDPVEDLAILECVGHDSPYFLRLSTDNLPPQATVHVIGYPGEITKEWLTARHPDLDDYVFSHIAANKLLPQDTLTATEGKISYVRDGYAVYEISTVVGMSGGCLLYNGKVYGINPRRSRLKTDIDNQGVHLGHKPNVAVLFSEARVRDFLTNNNLLNLVATSVGSFAMMSE